MDHNKNIPKKGITRRNLLVSGAAVGAVKSLPKLVASVSGRRVLTLYYDKALGIMRAVERVIH